MNDQRRSVPAAELSGSLAHVVVQSLVDAGITTVFGIGGTHTLNLLGELERFPEVKFVAARTELGAAYMAIGFARAARQPAVLLTSTGPGALNVTAALQDASWSSTPLIHLTTRIGGDEFAGAVHETPGQGRMLATAGKAVVDINTDDAVRQLRRAIEMAIRHPKGPVTIQVEAGTWHDDVAAAPVGPAPEAAPDAGSLTGVVDTLAAAVARSARPVVFVGGGALAGDGGAAVLALATKLGAPIVTSYQGKGITTWGDNLYLGPWGWEQPVQELFAEADLALVFGSKLSASGTAQWRLPLPAETYRVDIAGEHHPHYPHVRVVTADAADIAAGLTKAVSPRASWAPQQLTDIRATVLAGATQRGPDEMACVAATADAAPSWVSLDMTKAGFWMLKYLPARLPSAHLFSSYLAMGTALPMAIGAAVATGQPSMAVVGDGGFQMSIAELATLAEYRLPVTVMIIVDNAYGMLRDNRVAIGDNGTLGVTLWNPDLALVADAYGISSHQVATADRLRSVLGEPAQGPRILLVTAPFSRSW
ncbi:Acetolactate synthase [Mycolicibacterium rhodesiae JS60]|nr:Acetolactate synthase [Mycolicibacterium rhodesiae JS60]